LIRFEEFNYIAIAVTRIDRYWINYGARIHRVISINIEGWNVATSALFSWYD